MIVGHRYVDEDLLNMSSEGGGSVCSFTDMDRAEKTRGRPRVSKMSKFFTFMEIYDSEVDVGMLPEIDYKEKVEFLNAKLQEEQSCHSSEPNSFKLVKSESENTAFEKAYPVSRHEIAFLQHQLDESPFDFGAYEMQSRLAFLIDCSRADLASIAEAFKPTKAVGSSDTINAKLSRNYKILELKFLKNKKQADIVEELRIHKSVVSRTISKFKKDPRGVILQYADAQAPQIPCKAKLSSFLDCQLSSGKTKFFSLAAISRLLRGHYPELSRKSNSTVIKLCRDSTRLVKVKPKPQTAILKTDHQVVGVALAKKAIIHLMA